MLGEDVGPGRTAVEPGGRAVARIYVNASDRALRHRGAARHRPTDARCVCDRALAGAPVIYEINTATWLTQLSRYRISGRVTCSVRPIACGAVINLSDAAADGQIPLDWPELPGKTWRLVDLMSDVVYERDGSLLRDPGLYVALHPGQTHLLALS